MRSGLTLIPLEDDIGGWNHQYFAGIRVEGVLARQKRRTPDTAAALLDHLAMLILFAGEVRADIAGIGDHHAGVTDLDHGLGYHLDRGKQPVDIVRTLDQYLKLAATLPAGRQEALGVLEGVVIGLLVVGFVADRRCDDLPLWERRTIVDGDNADQVISALDNHRLEPTALFDDLSHPFEHGLFFPAQRQVIDGILSDDHELRQV